jgi:uncharacterized membrane protein
MVRKTSTRKIRQKDPIKWRGHEVTRVEAFSDAVFAFAVTLLIVSLEVPHTYDELISSVSFFIPFGVCFTILYMIWNTQNIFFRRFGLHDSTTITLNGLLLFLVLFFVYPLKFLFGGLFTGQFHIERSEQLRNLFYIYSGGFTSIYLVFAALYRNAIAKATELELTVSELYAARSHFYLNIVIASVGVLSLIVASLGPFFVQWAGMVYMLIWPAAELVFSKRKKKQKLLQQPPTDVIAELALDSVADDKVRVKK